MSKAFPYIQNTTYIITRNTSERRFFLRPSPELRDAILYCIADAQAQHPVHIHAFCAMSNHIHVVLTDPNGHAPQFVQTMNQNIARYVNCVLGRTGAMWEGGARPNYCVLPESGDALDKVVYTIANPVQAGLVQKHHLWPGALSTVGMIAKGRIPIERPRKYFSKTDDPELRVRELVLTPVPGANVVKTEDYMSCLEERVAQREGEAAEELEAKGRWFLGRRRCLAMRPDDVPQEPWKPFSHRPKVASRNPEARKAWLVQLRMFELQYLEAFRAFRKGNRNVVFPRWTFALRVYRGVNVGPLLA